MSPKLVMLCGIELEEISDAYGQGCLGQGCLGHYDIPGLELGLEPGKA